MVGTTAPVRGAQAARWCLEECDRLTFSLFFFFDLFFSTEELWGENRRGAASREGGGVSRPSSSLFQQRDRSEYLMLFLDDCLIFVRLMSESKLIALAAVVYTPLSSAASRAGQPPRVRRW